MLPICLTLNKFNNLTLGFIEYEDFIPIHINVCIDILWLMYGKSFDNFVSAFAETLSHDANVTIRYPRYA